MVTLPQHLTAAPVGRDPLPRGVRTEYQRERVLAAAAEVFARHGYQAASVDHIVSSARIGVGSFYALFDSKEACFLAVYDDAVAAARDRIVATQPAGGSWGERVAAGLRTLLEIVAAEPLAARVVLVEAPTAGAAALARHERNLECAAGLFRRGREQSPSAGQPLPATFEFTTVSGLAWLLQERLADGDIAVAKLFPEVLEMVVEPYLGEARTRGLRTG